MARLELIPQAVQHEYDCGLNLLANHCKAAARCILQLHTVGYATLGSGYEADQFKSYSMAEATFFGIQKTPLQQLLEDDGEWNVAATFRVDCTALFRYLDHDDIHCGENAEVLNQIMSNDGFVALLKQIKAACGYFLRDRTKDTRFDGLFFDPFRQCRSVAFARIIAFCLGRLDVQVL